MATVTIANLDTDIEFVQGTTPRIRLKLVYTDPADGKVKPFPLAGTEIVFTAKKNAADVDPLFRCTLSGGKIEIPTGFTTNDGVIDVLPQAGDSLGVDAGRFVYDVRVTVLADSANGVPVVGRLTLLPGVG